MSAIRIDTPRLIIRTPVLEDAPALNTGDRACWAALGFRERADLVLAQRSIPS